MQQHHLWHFWRVQRAGSVTQQCLPTTTASLTSGTSDSRIHHATMTANNNSFTHLWHFREQAPSRNNDCQQQQLHSPLALQRAGSVMQQRLPTTTASLTSGTSESRLRHATTTANNNSFTHLWHFREQALSCNNDCQQQQLHSPLALQRAGSVTQQ